MLLNNATLRNKRPSHIGCLIEKQQCRYSWRFGINTIKIHHQAILCHYSGGFTAENFQWKGNNALAAGCQQSWWRCRSRSPAVGRNISSGSWSFAFMCKTWNYTVIVLNVVQGVTGFEQLSSCLSKRRTKITWRLLSSKTAKKRLCGKLWSGNMCRHDMMSAVSIRCFCHGANALKIIYNWKKLKRSSIQAGSGSTNGTKMLLCWNSLGLVKGMAVVLLFESAPPADHKVWGLF